VWASRNCSGLGASRERVYKYRMTNRCTRAWRQRATLGASAVFFAALFAAGSASSQTMSIDAKRISRNARTVDSTMWLWINAADCYADDVLHFPLTLKGNIGLSTSVWVAHDATTDCFLETARLSASSNCRIVFSGIFPEGETPIDLRVQDLLLPSSRGPERGTSDVCRATRQVESSPVSLSVWFLNLAGDAQSPTVGAGLSWTTRYDLVPPDAPLASMTTMDDFLAIRWSRGRDTDVAGYRIYCTDADLQPVHDGGFADNDGGSDDLPCSAATITSSSGAPPLEYLYRDVVSPATMESLLVELKGAQRYACVVAAYDEAGNVSATSNVVCGTRQATHGTVDLNGRGGCGCFIGPRRHDAAAPWRSIAACFAIVLARARRRRSQA
jgi:hypothetical protein